MLYNYFTVALRNLWRNKLYTVLNVVGLAIGISACLVIFLIVRFESSFDTFQPDRERIYRVYTQFSGAFQGTNQGVSTALPPSVRNQSTGLEAATAFYTYEAKVLIEGDKRPRQFDEQKDLVLADPEYFEVFRGYQWLAGSPARHSLRRFG